MTQIRNSRILAPTLVLGASGKTGRRVKSRLEQRGVEVRSGSRRAAPAFDWNDPSTWNQCLSGARALYLAYPSDLPVAGSAATIGRLVSQAKRVGVERIVLLTGRGEDEALRAEGHVRESGLEWTVVRASWFAQNFSEGSFAAMVQDGQLVVPDGLAPEPFLDIDDLADVAVAALTEAGHMGMTYELTGPRLMSFAEVARELTAATGRAIDYVAVSHQDFLRGAAEDGAPPELVSLLDYLFGTLLDGRNAHTASGVSQALGRPARDFSDFARTTASAGAWRTVA